MEFDVDGIPEPLQSHDSWICWAEEERDGKLTKVPRDPRDVFGEPCDPTDPEDWTSFEQAVETARESPEDFGIGYCFSEKNVVVGLDLDNCRDPETGDIDAWAREYVDRFDSFTQVSTSGTGLHVFALGLKPGDKCRTGDVPDAPDDAEVEYYEADRFFAMTGWHLEGTPETVERRADVVRAVYDELFVDEPEDDQATLGEAGADRVDDLSDAELLERARNAANGDRFQALWQGDTSGYPSHSEADLALCSHLAFWTGGDPARMDALFRRSGLMRDKWDEDRGDRTYGERTIEKALSGQSEFYEPPQEKVALEGVEPQTDGEAATNGGGAAADRPDDEAEAVAGGPSISDWEQIRAQYRRAHESGENTTQLRKSARFVATRRLEEVENHFATNEVSDHLYVYDEDEGIYLDRGEPHVHECLVDELREQFSQSEKNEILSQIKGRTYHPPDEFGAPPGYVPVENGILHIGRDGVEDVLDHTPAHLFLAKVQTEYDPDAECPAFDEWLEERIPDSDDRKMVMEYFGYCLLNWGLPHHKVLFAVGPEASGKSTLLDVLRELLGRDSVSSIAPQELVNNRFTAIQLWKTWANIRNDISAEMLHNVGKFKEIAAGDPIYVEDKHETGFEIEPTAKHVFSANQLPDIQTDDNAFFRRILLVALPRKVPADDRDEYFMQDELLPELPGILNRALEGLERVMEQGRFTGDMTPVQTRETWEAWGDSVSRFKNECLAYQTDVIVPKGEAYTAYKAFCEQETLPSVGQRKMTTELKKDPQITDSKRSVEGYDRQQRVFVGVKLKDEWKADVGPVDDDEDVEDPDGRLDDF